MNEFLTLTERFRSISGSEDDYAQTLHNFAPILFPDYDYVRWDPRVYRSDSTYQQPDAFLVHRSLTEWHTVEVELAHHSTSHIASQLETFSIGSYGADFRAGLAQRLTKQDAAAVESLLLRQRPGVICIVNALSERLREICTAHEAELVVIERFLSDGGQTALWTRHLPHRLGTIGRVGVWPLDRTGRLLGNREMAYLPIDFPSVNQIHIQYEEMPASTCAVRELSSRRFINLPADWTSATRGQFFLYAVDPRLDVYQFVVRPLK